MPCAGENVYPRGVKRLFFLLVALAPAISTVSAAEPKPASGKASTAPVRDYARDLARDQEPTHLVTYKRADGRELRLHIFEPTGWRASDRRSCLLTVHGGGWAGGEPRRMYPFAAHFAERGGVGISLEYRLMKGGSKVTPWDCAADGRDAIRYVKEHAAELGIDPRKIVASGGSAGGHVAAGMAMFDRIDAAGDRSIDPSPAALVLYYPVIDTSPAGCGNRACGARWKEISPLHQVRPGLPPTIIFHGTADKTTPYAGAKAFQAAMEAAGNRCELESKEGAGHTYLMFEKDVFEDTIRRTDEFLASLKL